MYPTKLEVAGEIYPIDTDYRTALECLKISEDKTICDEERAMAILYLLYGFIPDENIEEFMKKAVLFLQCGETNKQQNDREKDMDFFEDKRYIIASFMSDYRIDLSQNNPMHFWFFVDLIVGLTENSILNKVRQIRSRDLSEIEDDKFRAKVREAQEQLALKNVKSKASDEQIESAKRFLSSLNIGTR